MATAHGKDDELRERADKLIHDIDAHQKELEDADKRAKVQREAVQEERGQAHQPQVTVIPTRPTAQPRP